MRGRLLEHRGVLFANLLPGLRELRAPLAAGYVLFVALWILAIGDVPSERDATGLAATLYDLRDVIDTAGLAAAVTFAAYVVGSVVADATEWTYGRVPRFGSIGHRGERAIDDLVKRTFDEAMAAVPARLDRDPAPSDEQVRMEEELARLAVNAMGGPENAPERLLTVVPEPRGGSETDARKKAKESLLAELGAKVSHFTNPREKWGVVAGMVVRESLSDRVQKELDLVRTRLLGTDSELHGAVDRLRTEAELRLGLAPSLALLVVAFAGRELWWGALVTAALIPVLITQAVRRRRGGGDLVADALALGRVRAPTLERFARLAGIREPGQPDATAPRAGDSPERPIAT
jgi:hypothetical protein